MWKAFCAWVDGLFPTSQYPKGPLPPETIAPPVVVGACGVTGCPNKQSHSHVEDLVRRVREK